MTVDANGVRLHCEQSGAGSPMLLLHGNGEDHHIFDALRAKLDRHFTVYAIDSRNHGQSGKTGDYAYRTMAEDVFAFIRTMRLGRVDVVGFSDGAIISLLLAMEHAEVLRKMALLGVNLKPGDFTEESLQWIRDSYAQTKDPLYKLMLEQPDIELEEVTAVAVPTLLIAGENDLFRPETFENLRAALPDASLKIMAGHSHDSYIVGQDMLYPDLIQFFSP